MKPWAPIIAGLVAAGLAGAASAQTLQRGADPEAQLNDTLIVRAMGGGPAWWKVSDGDSVVWILGLPQGLSKTVRWDDRLLQSRLARADALILPPDMRPSPIKALFFFLKHRGEFRSRRPIEEGLPAPLAQRFDAARAKLGQPASHYAGWKPLVAAAILAQDVRKPAKFDPAEPEGRVRALASRAGVRERRAGSYGGQVLAAFTAIPDEAQVQCLEDSLDEVEAGSERMIAAGRGWAEGDVRASLTLARGYDRCLAMFPAISALLVRGQTDTAAAIKTALARPGHSVALVELRALLARGGVLDRLKAQGVKVQTPGDSGS